MLRILPLVFIRLSLLFLLGLTIGEGQTAPPPEAGAGAGDIRSTPRGALLGFLDASRVGDFRRASSFLNIQSEHRGEGNPEELARDLKQVLDRGLSQDPASISNTPEGDLVDGLESDKELLGTIRNGDRVTDLYLERVASSEGRQIWVVSAATVSLIPKLRTQVAGNAIEKRLPDWMLQPGAFDTRIWQWIALVILTLAALGVGNVLARVLIRSLRPIVRRTQSQLDDTLVDSIRGPIQLLIALAAYRIGIVWIAPSYLLRTYLGRVLTGVIYLAIAWVVVRIIDIVSTKIVASMSGRQKTTAASIMPLTRRTLKAAAVIFAILATLTSWGYDTTALLAGLGVGGLAVALAAQKTIENLFGGVAITTDKPVLVGDFCRYGDKLGTVEEIGLRSTRLRSLDRTVVTVPNSAFSALHLENFGLRDKMSFRPTLELTRDTTPQQLRSLIPRLEQLLKTHPKVDPAARVRFTKIGSQSLDLEVFSYVLTPNYDEFLVLQQEILLRLLEIIAEEGAALAVPEQRTVLRREARPSSTPQS